MLMVTFHCCRLGGYGITSNLNVNVSDGSKIILTYNDPSDYPNPPTYYVNDPVEVTPGLTYTFPGGMSWYSQALFTVEATSWSQTEGRIAQGSSNNPVSWTCPANPPTDLWFIGERD